MAIQNASAVDLIKQLDLSEDQLIKLQQGALNTDPHVLCNAIKASMQSFAARVANIEKQESIDQAFKFLHTVAEVSPTVRARMGDLYNVNPQSLLADTQQLTKLQAVFKEVTQTKDLQQIDVEIHNAIDLALEAAKEERKAHAQRLNAALKTSQARQAALDEMNATTEKAITSKRDNAMFDTLRALGVLIRDAIFLGFIVPIYEDYYPGGFKYIEPTTDEYRDLYKKVYSGTDVLPTEEQIAAKNDLPPWLKAW